MSVYRKKCLYALQKFEKVRLPKSLLEIGDWAFSDCAIEEIAVPPNVQVIGSYAFSSRSLKKILLPDHLKFISNGMLSRTSIEEINIPQSVMHIGSYAFSDTKLKAIDLPDDLYSIQSFAFETPNLKRTTMHSNIKMLDENIFGESVKPIINCAAGSKGQLYARKYGMNCQEISARPSVKVRVCASEIILLLETVTKGDIIGEIYRSLGINKAATWSWNVEVGHRLCINKNMNMDDAIQMKKMLQEFAESHNNWSEPGFHCALKEISVCECWGRTVV